MKNKINSWNLLTKLAILLILVLSFSCQKEEEEEPETITGPPVAQLDVQYVRYMEIQDANGNHVEDNYIFDFHFKVIVPSNLNYSFKINYGDGKSENGDVMLPEKEYKTTHAYTQPGKYEYVFTATDPNGEKAEVKGEIIVQAQAGN